MFRIVLPVLAVAVATAVNVPNVFVLHPFWSAVVAYWVYSAAVDNLPEPNGNKFYRWAYGFLHTIAGNLKTAFAAKLPGIVQDQFQPKQ